MKMILFSLFILMIASISTYGQVVTIENFNKQRPDTIFTPQTENITRSYVTLKYDSTDKVEGTGSIVMRTKLDSLHSWGTYAQFSTVLASSATPWDWSGSDTLSLWLKVRMAPSLPQYMVFRITILDQPTPSSSVETYIYQNNTIIDAASGWVHLLVPIKEIPSLNGSYTPDSTGFVEAPYGWGGFTWNNHKLDRNKIVGWRLVAVTTPPPTPPAGSTNIPMDSIEVAFDKFERSGFRSIPFVYFTGKDYDGTHVPASGLFTWSGVNMSVVLGAGPTAGLNAIKMVQVNGSGGGGANLSPAVNLAGAWHVDSLNFMMKVDVGTGALRAQFETAAAGKRGSVFTPSQDGQWHQYSLPLRSFINENAGHAFDSSAITVFQFMTENSGIAGKMIWITNVWTGNPTLDVIPPDSAKGLNVASSTFSNVFSWNAVTNKPSVTYNVYVADHPWTDPTDSTVEDIPPYNIQALNVTHILRAPNTNQLLTYYYGVQAKDASGNLSGTSLKGPITTLAKGVPTIAKAPPTNFAADGDLSEWISAGIKPFLISKDSGTAHVNENGVIDNDADCSAKAYLAVDANYLYVAIDVTDDVVKVDTASSLDYEQDAPDLFIGLYDWRGKFHNGLPGGAKPDYHIRFSQNRVRLDGLNVTLMYAYSVGANPNPDYAWIQKIIGSGYTVEAKIPFTAFTKARSGDNLFVPTEGMRIPIDFEINDRDNKAAADFRDGMLCYSPLNNDNSYQDMWHWTYTWIGNLMTPTVSVEQVNVVPVKYTLSQNYPNPFNPSTRIDYSIEKFGKVSLKIYDMLGREVSTLVDKNQVAGTYTVTFNTAGQSFSSGVYFYRLISGSFVATHKLILLK
jgi:hypothetical protein